MRLGSAAAPLAVHPVTLLHVRHVLAILAAVVLALGGEEPAAVALAVTLGALDQLRLEDV